MECPICKQEMKQVRTDTSYNTNANNKAYHRVVYQCQSDDAWITTEVPDSASANS